MTRFILRYGGGKEPNRDDLAAIRATRGLVVVDEASERMVLVEGRRSVLDQLVARLSGWILVEEDVVPLPDPRPRVAAPPARHKARHGRT